MKKCCGQKPTGETGCLNAPVSTPKTQSCTATELETPCRTTQDYLQTADSVIPWFDSMVDHCYEFAEQAHAEGKPIVGIMCEFTPRELIMAAGGIPVCLCGGSAEMISPAEEDLPSNLCPLIKSTYGYHKEKTNPFLEWASLIVAETTCDGKKKMYELMAENRDMHVLELPQKPDDQEAFDHWFCEIRKLKEKLQEKFKVQITDQKLLESIKTMNQERLLKKEIAYLMQSPKPLMNGTQLLKLNTIISPMPQAMEQYQKLINSLRNIKKEPAFSRKRVLLTGVPLAHGAARIVELIEENNGIVVAMENCSGLKPIMHCIDETSSDPLKAIAEHYFYNIPCSVMTKNDRRLDMIRQIAADFQPDCIIELVWQACLTYDVESFRIKRLAIEELDLPYLKIVTDYSPSDSARISTRIQALFETL